MKKTLLLITALFMLFITAKAQTQTFNYTGSIDSFIVPAGVTSITINSIGAQGGNDNGGLGAEMQGDFNVTPGEEIKIVVGQQGIVNTCGGADASGGGGGGSFVWLDSNDSLLIAAGGGGGGNENWGDLICRAGVDAVTTQDGTSGAENEALGGINGNGGAGNASSGTGSGGAGWLSNGENSTWGGGCTGGESFPSFTGGNGATGFGPGGEGGFGGGGGAVCGSGGGGGYSGGAGGNGNACRAGGGGGGSFNTGTNQTNTAGVQSGNGQVVITWSTICTVNIPDAVFKAFLVNASYINTNNDSEIQCSEASAYLFGINCSNMSISDLTGIEAFTALTSLKCQSNSLTSLDLSQNTNLTELWCYFNSISNLNISQNVNLTSLHCYNNPIGSLDVTNMSNLSLLNCQTTSISTLDVSSNLLLTELSIVNNSITSIDLSNNAALASFVCSDNYLTNLDISNNPLLQTFNCRNNSLTNLDLSQHTALTSIICSDNILTDLNVANSNNTNITYFQADGNSNLTCIEVDDVAYSTTNWTNIDATASFSTNCNPILVNSIIVDGQGGVSTITTQGGTLQMEATVLPANADDATYTWSVDNSNATISTTGLLSAVANGTVIVTATANDGSGISGTKTITISNQTGGGNVAINESEFETLKVFPNPTNGIVNLEVREPLNSVKLLDLTGKTVKEFDANTTQLDISDINSGIYFLEIANTEKKSIIKLIKR